MKILRLPPNEQGRDFVCGDIHGSYSCVQRALAELNFDKTKDRLICAGDIIDRGPENEKCLEFLFEPWFYCCMGNHEHMMLHYFTGGPYGYYWGGNGGNWGTKYKMWAVAWEAAGNIDPSAKTPLGEWVRATVLHKVAELPYLITVEKKGGGIFHVLHAELPPRVSVCDADLADEKKLAELAKKQTSDGDTIIWGRFMFYAMCRQTMDETHLRKIRRFATLEKLDKYFVNLSHIYSGHTIVKQPVQFFGQTNLDTMAYGSYGQSGGYGYASTPGPEWAGLTITEPATGKFWLVNDREFKETKPLVIDALPPGNYTKIELSEETD